MDDMIDIALLIREDGCACSVILKKDEVMLVNIDTNGKTRKKCYPFDNINDATEKFNSLIEYKIKNGFIELHENDISPTTGIDVTQHIMMPREVVTVEQIEVAEYMYPIDIKKIPTRISRAIIIVDSYDAEKKAYNFRIMSNIDVPNEVISQLSVFDISIGSIFDGYVLVDGREYTEENIKEYGKFVICDVYFAQEGKFIETDDGAERYMMSWNIRKGAIGEMIKGLRKNGLNRIDAVEFKTVFNKRQLDEYVKENYERYMLQAIRHDNIYEPGTTSETFWMI